MAFFSEVPSRWHEHKIRGASCGLTEDSTHVRIIRRPSMVRKKMRRGRAMRIAAIGAPSHPPESGEV
jgi:hypothetical protein